RYLDIRHAVTFIPNYDGFSPADGCDGRKGSVNPAALVDGRLARSRLSRPPAKDPNKWTTKGSRISSCPLIHPSSEAVHDHPAGAWRIKEGRGGQHCEADEEGPIPGDRASREHVHRGDAALAAGGRLGAAPAGRGGKRRSVRAARSSRSRARRVQPPV